MAKFGKRNDTGKWIMAVLIIFAVGLLSFGNLFSSSGSSSRSTRDIALSCTTDMFTTFHIHPHLEIIVNGAKQTISANTGVNLACMHPLHTHDDTGTIHVESPEKRDFVLGDFFAVWGKQFSKDQILDYKRDAGHEIVVTVGGKQTEEYENLVLEDGQQIVIEYRAVRPTTK